MPARPSSRVLRAAVVVEDKLSGELHQTAPGSVKVGWALHNDLVVMDGLDRRKDPRRAALPLLIIGALMLVAGLGLFVPEYLRHHAEAETSRVQDELCSCLLDPTVRMSSSELEALDGPPPWRSECEEAKAAGELEPRAEKLKTVCKPADFKAAYGQENAEGVDKGLWGIGLLFMGLAPLMAGIAAIRSPRLKPRKRPKKRPRPAPESVRLFEYRRGRYYLNLPKEARGKVTLAKGKRAYSVKQLRKKQGTAQVQVGLRSTAKGKILLGNSVVLFQFARPKKVTGVSRRPPDGLGKVPLPMAYGMTVGLFGLFAAFLFVVGPVGAVLGLGIGAGALIFLQRNREPLFGVALLGSVLVLGSFGMWISFGVEPVTDGKVNERMIQAMGVVYEPEEDEPEPEPEPEEEEEEEEEELKQPDEQKKQKVEPDKVVKTPPKKYSEAAVKKARGVGIARTLGTYGGPGEGSIIDVIEGTENNLGELFDKGMGRVADADGTEVSDFVAGGEGISASGAVVGTEGLKTTEDQPEVAKKKKREKKVKGKVKSSTSEVFGDVDKTLVTRTIKRRMGALQSCYEKSLRSQSGLKGKISFTITISARGRVVKVAVEQNTLGDSATLSCCKAKIKGWRFPVEGAEDSSEVTFSVVFSQAS